MIRAAKYLGVAPWELERQPLRWQKVALLCELAETRSEAIRAKIDEHRNEPK